MSTVLESLHTRYRPQNLDEVYGQDTIVGVIENAIEEGRAKSFIFTGPSGVGKTTLARIMANEFAGKAATAANIQEVDAATHSGADAMRAIAGKSLYRAPSSSPVKAIIVDEAHKLSSTAWDALLKPIEEPPEHVYWMFCTTNPGKIPKTIQTRCMRFDLNPVDENEILKLLDYVVEAEEFEIENEVLETIAEHSDGSPRQALVFLETCKYCETKNEALTLMRSAGETVEIIELCRFLLNTRGRTWKNALKIINSFPKNTEAESIRIVIVNYIAKALLNTTDEEKAINMFEILECFEQPYNTTDKFGPLLLSVARVLDMDR